MKKSCTRLAMLAMAGLTAVGVTAPGSASAATQVGWTGATPSLSGTIYLHNSSITDVGGLHARTKIWTSFGNTVAPGIMGVRTRLFKSGVMCEVVDYVANTTWVANVESESTVNCGSGSYNSHGFVRAFDGTSFQEYVTFPSNPINFTAPASARASRIASNPPKEVSRSFSINGKSYGVASQDPESKSPDFVGVYADSGKFGYVSTRSVDSAKKGTAIPVVDADGKMTPEGFTIR